jgi:hypothetical protein
VIKMKTIVLPVILLAIVMTVGLGQIEKNKVSACSLDDIGSCLRGIGSGSGYYAGQQDAQYDRQQGLEYNPVAACCHSPDWNDQFSSGYNQEWNQVQSSSQVANLNIENSPGTQVTVNQGSTQGQNQGPLETPIGCSDNCGGGCDGSCQDCGSCQGCDNCGTGCSSLCGGCDGGCNIPYYHWGWFHHFHHFGCGFSCGPYRHIDFGGEDQ